MPVNPASAHLDHPALPFAPTGPASSAFNSGGGDWELITTVATGNPHTDLDYFTSGGEIYAAVGTLATGGNFGGVTIVKLTEGGDVQPSVVGAHPSAACLSDPSAALSLQHDVEATPKGDVFMNHDWFGQNDTRDAQLVIDATDAEGRCHDGGMFGFGAPKGGLEIIDITDPTAPVEIGLISHIGEAHTVNVDPRRAHIAYAVSSDSVTVGPDVNDLDGDGDTEELIRNNEDPESGDAGDLDGFEIVDLSSCMNFVPGTSVSDKRESCRPTVFRFRWPTLDWTLGHTNPTQVHGCHEVEFHPGDVMACAAIDTTLLLDLSGMFDDNGTPDDFTDDTINGDPLPCAARPSTSAPPFGTGATVIDCVVGEGDVDLTIPSWLADGAPSATGVEWLGSAFHMGREDATGSAVDPAFGALEDIDAAHESELSHSGRFVFTTDERGGGVLPGGASCDSEEAIDQGNGGIHAYAVDRLLTRRPADAEDAFSSYARTPDGDKAVVRAPVTTGAQGTFCTAHVFHKIPGQNRMFMGWYSQGTHVFDWIEHDDGTLEWRHVGWFTPENANTWVSAIFRMEENEDGTWTYWGATGDFFLGAAGRSSVDVYKVTMKPPAQFASGALADDPAEPLPPPAPEPPAPDTPTTGDAGVATAGFLLLAVALFGLSALRRDTARPGPPAVCPGCLTARAAPSGRVW